MAIKNRNEMNEAYQWKLSHIFPTPEAWSEAMDKAREALKTLSSLPGTLKTSKESLKSGLDTIYGLGEQVSLLYIYAMLQKQGDNGDPQAQVQEGQAMNLYVEFSTAISFVDPEILTIPEEKLKAWMADPLLSDYRHILHNTARNRPHTLPEAQEKMLSQLSDAAGTPENVFSMLEAVDMTFPEVLGEDGNPAPLSHGTYGLYRASRNREVRKTAFEVYHGQFKKFINTTTATYAGAVKLDNYYATVRSYPSSLQKALFADNVPTEVYDALVKAVHEKLPLMERYLRLRKKALGLSELHMYDLYSPMVEEAEFNIPYEEAKVLVKKATEPLGERYGQLLDLAYSQQWMDVYENKGKTAGAFACGVHGVHPYVLLNYTDSLNDAFTMAHELGHAMHSYLSSEQNSFANHDYSIMVAEVASTVNEVLMAKYFLKTETDKNRRAYILNYLLEMFRTTVFRQTLFAEFEREAHAMYARGETLTADALCSVYSQLNKTYYPGVTVDELIGVEWSEVPHFYSPFYVYQYATGLCSAVAIAENILRTGDPTDYLRFLSTGASDYPMEELKIAGVDLADPSVVEDALRLFEETVTELEEVLSSD